ALAVALLGIAVVSYRSWMDWGARPPAQRAGGYGEAVGEATFVGRQACAACHPREVELWRGSDHDLAMQAVDEKTVLGDFDNATFTYFGVTSTFFKRDGKFFVRTDGPDGELHEYEIAYTLGASPLQQYLVPFRGGRYQALSIAWDTRRREQGGQRWFHLYPDEKIDHADLLHWTRPNQNWNFMCAECHSTNLKKNYRLDGNRYETTWSEIDVSCEACHGPGSRHVAWAKVARRGDQAEKGKTRGLLVVLKDRGTWVPDPEKGTARRASPPGPRREVEACARCHSRRVVIRADYVHGRPLLDTHRLALLREGLYHADGQLQEETYVYGSFLQSRMYRAGVTCSDCHEPHSLALRATGNAVCTQCHQAAKFDTPSHHFHRPGSPGAACVECHMPVRTYMVVDPRRDHSLRIPRPDLSVRLGTPDPCTACHRDRAPGWAAETVARWSGSKRRSGPHFGDALHLGRSGHPGAEAALRELATNPEAPAIVRASAVSLLRRYPTPAALGVIRRALGDRDPLVRAAAVRALEIT
ncbi:MAG: multiheme c-type cytochrome, partial [Alphaproteobacteria bacterium]